MNFTTTCKSEVFTLTAEVATWRCDPRSDGVYVVEWVFRQRTVYGPMNFEDARGLVANRQEKVLTALENMRIAL